MGEVTRLEGWMNMWKDAQTEWLFTDGRMDQLMFTSPAARCRWSAAPSRCIFNHSARKQIRQSCRWWERRGGVWWLWELIGAIDNGKALLLFQISESTNLPKLTLPGSSGRGVGGVFLNDRPTQHRRQQDSKKQKSHQQVFGAPVSQPRSASVIPHVKLLQGQTLGPLPVTGGSPPESRTTSLGFKQTPACVHVDGWVTLTLCHPVFLHYSNHWMHRWQMSSGIAEPNQFCHHASPSYWKHRPHVPRCAFGYRWNNLFGRWNVFCFLCSSLCISFVPS